MCGSARRARVLGGMNQGARRKNQGAREFSLVPLYLRSYSAGAQSSWIVVDAIFASVTASSAKTTIRSG